MTSLPKTMRAARMHQFGDPSVLKIEEIPLPKVLADDVLIKVMASSINPIDCKTRSGLNRTVLRRKPPFTPGMDVSGEVVAVGQNVTSLSVGDEVYSSPDHHRDGTYAEYVAIKANQVALKPKNMTHEEAASIPLVGLTAWDCLVGHANIQSGQRVLVQAGSGGVGSFGIQLAKAMGTHVITTCSQRNIELVKSLGADQVIDYNEQSIAQAVDAPLDACLDAINNHQDTLDMIQACKPGGHVSSITSGLPTQAKKYGLRCGVLATGLAVGRQAVSAQFNNKVSFRPVVRSPNRENLEKITALIEDNKIKAVIDKTYPLEQIVEAHTYSETGRARGKIIITF